MLSFIRFGVVADFVQHGRARRERRRLDAGLEAPQMIRQLAGD
ncbi:MAG TPA: hypothetical protein VN628_09435 [Vicinamibacterales bacterium]|nr:hypothetical protein [Vicinamibacterales bacterium]